MKMERVKYKSLHGIRIKSDIPVKMSQFDTDLHMHRAAYLACLMEAPKWGSVQGYDNAGMSGGPFHFIARFPRDGSQGPLFRLLRRIEQDLGTKYAIDGEARPDMNSHLRHLWNMLLHCGWYVATDGKLRATRDGSVVPGNVIRDEFAPIKGKVPAKGYYRVQAEAWAEAFYDLLSDPVTYPAQIDYCIEWLNAGQKALELGVYSKLRGEKVHHTQRLDLLCGNLHGQEFDDLMDNAVDLAMCFYHDNSVNAPGAAASCLRKAKPVLNGRLTSEKVNTFATRLIKLLGTKKYGAWDKRYKRTRKHAMESGLWEQEFFKGRGAIMPARF
jgi:hypothetical protein